jgi:hypothetical protein
LDTEKDIEKAAKKPAKDRGWSKLKALSVIHSRYQSENRLEEATIVDRLIEKEESISGSAPGFMMIHNRLQKSLFSLILTDIKVVYLCNK